MTEVIATSETGGMKGRKAEEYGLIPPHALEEVARVYGYGASKYTSRVSPSCKLLAQYVQLEPCENIQKLLNAIQTEGTPLGDYASSATVRNILKQKGQDVIRTGLEDLVNSVAHAMTENSRKQILSIIAGRKKTHSRGQDSTETTERNTSGNTGLASGIRKDHPRSPETSSYVNSDLLKNLHLRFLLTKMGVPFATLLQEGDTTTSTMTTILENLEDSYAVDVTRDLVCLEIAKLVFPLLSNTSGASIEGDHIVSSGAHNWAKGYPYTWSLSALGRHIKQFEKGERLDKESGIPHLAHATFHLFTLMEFDRTGRGTDDRLCRIYEAQGDERKQ